MLILIRHGRTDANRRSLLQGRADNELDDAGRAQAAAVAAHLDASVDGGLGAIDRVITSPLRRAVATAEALGHSVTTDERFLELDYGDWEGRPVADVPAHTWQAWRSDPRFRPPGGETLTELGERVRRGIAAVAAERNAEAGPTVIVSHVSPMKAMLAWALGVDDDATWRMHIAQAAICRIDLRHGTPVVTSMNEHVPQPQPRV